jgi:hypothetical protein
MAATERGTQKVHRSVVSYTLLPILKLVPGM